MTRRGAGGIKTINSRTQRSWGLADAQDGDIQMPQLAGLFVTYTLSSAYFIADRMQNNCASFRFHRALLAVLTSHTV